jgi:4-hydroxy-4-methyl-2-oxoglutarate aldolase
MAKTEIPDYTTSMKTDAFQTLVRYEGEAPRERSTCGFRDRLIRRKDTAVAARGLPSGDPGFLVALIRAVVRVSQHNAISLAWILAVSALSAQAPYDTPIPPDKPVPEDVRTNRQSYSAVLDVLERERTAVTDAQLEELARYQLENIWGSMGEYRDTNYARGFQTTQPGKRIVGRALTMRFLPSRPDLDKAARALAEEGDWDRRFYIRAGEEAQPNDIVVVDLGGAEGGNYFGDITALGIKMRGAKGVIIDGGTRDLAELRAETFADFPVFARFFSVDPNRWVGSEWNVPIRIGGATVVPGDIVVADEGGVLFVPPQIVAEVLERCRERERREDFERGVVESKKYRIRDVYPLHPKLEEQLRQQR